MKLRQFEDAPEGLGKEPLLTVERDKWRDRRKGKIFPKQSGDREGISIGKPAQRIRGDCERRGICSQRNVVRGKDE
jgi:hypothetical protein